MKRQVIQPRLRFLLATLGAVLFLLPAFFASAETVNPPTEPIRVVVDGTVHEMQAALIDGDWHLSPGDVQSALGVAGTPAENGFVNLRQAAKQADVSYEHDGVLRAAYLWTDMPYGESVLDTSGDYTRAFTFHLVPDTWGASPAGQITSNEFRDALLALVTKLEPSRVEAFENKVTTYKKPMLRGEGFVMAYYASVCLDADYYNNDFDHTKVDSDDFWSTEAFAFDALYPHFYEGPVSVTDSDNVWNDAHAASFLWVLWHSSPVSDQQLFAYDPVAQSMHQYDPLTYADAACAIARLYDSCNLEDVYIPITDARATEIDTSILTDTLLQKAGAYPAPSTENLPAWTGFVLSDYGSYESTRILPTEKDLHNIANWGFNSSRLMLTYQTLFDAEVKTVNISNLQKLDQLVAAAIRYRLHLNLLTFSVPGRWTQFNNETFKTTAELDLFTNPTRQQEANALWALLATRYRDIPSATLSFSPLWEVQNYALSSGLAIKPYTRKQITDVYQQLIQTIRDIDPDRFIIYEPTANNRIDDIIRESEDIKTAIESKWNNVLMMVNFCEIPYVYAEMTATSGEHIDHNNHSMFKPDYPVTLYAAQYHISKGKPLTLQGELPAGTSIVLYLAQTKGKGDFTVTADGAVLLEKRLSAKKYKTEYPLSGLYPFAKSNQAVTVTLPADAQTVEIGFGGNWFEWSGIEVTLPSAYAVERWWFPSEYDLMLNLVDSDQPSRVLTSTIMISPNSYDSGRILTLHSDLTYTSDTVQDESTPATIQNWADKLSVFSPQTIIRFESAGFNTGATQQSVLRYYGDMLAAIHPYRFGWYSNDYWDVVNANGRRFAGAATVAYNDYRALNADLLRLLQAYQDHGQQD